MFMLRKKWNNTKRNPGPEPLQLLYCPGIYYFITEKDAERVREDYITARRAWITEIRKDAEKEFALGDVEEEVLENFIGQLDREVDFENQKLYM